MEEKINRPAILRAVVITAFLTTFMGSALNLSIPELETEFSVGAALIGWVVTTYTLAVAAMSVPFGKVADIKGRRPVFLAGLTGFIASSLLCGVSVNIWMLLVFRGVQGVFASMIFASNNPILIASYPQEERGRVLGISTAAVYVGLSAGPVVGGWINDVFNWRVIFFLTAAIGILALLLVVRAVPRTEERPTAGKVDVQGNLLYMACIIVSLWGLSNLSLLRWSWLALVLGLVLGAAFVYTETKADNPVIRVEMFTEDASFTLSNLAALFNYGATFAISYLMSIYLQVVMGFSARHAGLILIAQPAMQALFSPMMGRLSDRIAPHKLASCGMGFCALGLVLFSRVGTETGLGFVLAALMLSGFGFALFSSPNTNAIMGCVQPRDYSVANSILSTMRTVGQTSSMALVTVVVGFRLGNRALDSVAPKTLVSTMHICFLIFIGLCVLGVFMSLKRNKA